MVCINWASQRINSGINGLKLFFVTLKKIDFLKFANLSAVDRNFESFCKILFGFLHCRRHALHFRQRYLTFRSLFNFLHAK